MQLIFIVWMLMFTFIHAGLTDDAYSAYKEGDKEKAFELYTKGAEQGNIKANYNLAVFYEKGIGTDRDLPEALKLYKKVLNSIKDSIDYCTPSKRRYYKKTFEKLARYKKDPTYSKHMKTLEAQCRYQEYPTIDEDRAFIQKCPNAKIIPVEYRREIFQLPCKYFKHYPKIMKKYMPLYIQVQNDRKYQNISEKKAKTTEHKLRTLVHPILLELKKNEISCYKKAKTAADQTKCMMKHVAGIDTLFVTDLSVSYHDAMYLHLPTKERNKEAAAQKRKLTAQERERMVQQAQDELHKEVLIPGDYKLDLP